MWIVIYLLLTLRKHIAGRQETGPFHIHKNVRNFKFPARHGKIFILWFVGFFCLFVCSLFVCFFFCFVVGFILVFFVCLFFVCLFFCCCPRSLQFRR